MDSILNLISYFEFIIAFLAVSLMIALNYWMYNRSAVTRRWRAVPATITESFVLQRPGPKFKNSRRQDHFEPVVFYNYEVDGKIYNGNQVTRGKFSSSAQISARKLVEPFPIGKKVQAYVDPENPDEAVLLSKINPFVWIFTVFNIITLTALLFIVVGTVVFNEVLAGFIDAALDS